MLYDVGEEVPHIPIITLNACMDGKRIPGRKHRFCTTHPSYLCYTALEEKVMELHSKNRLKKVIITDIAIKKV